MDAISAMLRYTGPNPMKAHRVLQTRPARPPFIRPALRRNSPNSHAAVESAVNEAIERSRKCRISCCSLPIRRIAAASLAVDFVAESSGFVSSRELESSFACTTTCFDSGLGDDISTASPCCALSAIMARYATRCNPGRCVQAAVSAEDLCEAEKSPGEYGRHGVHGRPAKFTPLLLSNIYLATC